MIPKHNVELIRSLNHKKYREDTGLFVAEGEKIIFDLLKTKLKLANLYFTSEAEHLLKDFPDKAKLISLSNKEMERISAFKTPSNLLALFEIPPYQEIATPSTEGLSLVLDGIQDPGNLGTIIRLADWFGIRNIYCSENCVDQFNPKCVQSTMGAIARVSVHYLPLIILLQEAVNLNLPIYGTYMEGGNIYQSEVSGQALIVMGSEGKGISPELETFMTKKLSIPTFPVGNMIPESLNVAVSTAIICSEFRRRS